MILKQFYIIFKKEFYAYFNTGLAFILLAVYAMISMLSTYYLGMFFNLGNSGLFSFFYFQADIFVLLAPALTMRLWAEERKSGTIEFLLTQPVALSTIVSAKFFAAWLMCLVMILMTVPFWLYANFNFTLDNLNILSSYLGVLLVGGAFSAVGCMISSFSSSPIIAYMITLFISWGITIGNFSSFLKQSYISNEITSRILSSLNFSKHYNDFMSGQVSPDNLIYFLCLILFALWLNLVSIEYKRN